jgi:hypothetical protein
VETIAEIWESTDDPMRHTGDGRRLVLLTQEADGLSFALDYTFRDQEGVTLSKELHALSKRRVAYDGKKSAQIISQLTIAIGIFVVGGIAGGFLQAVGTVVYGRLKDKLKSIRSKPDNQKASRILVRFTLKSGDREIEANTVLDDATPEMINQFFDKSLVSLDQICTKVIEQRPDTVRIVTKQTDEQLELLYDVRDDGFPFIHGD